jgi:hypothetical protein
VRRKANQLAALVVIQAQLLQKPRSSRRSVSQKLDAKGIRVVGHPPKEVFSHGLLDPHRKALLGDSNAALVRYGKG